ncbi:hypothetical protein GCM10010517_05470 [Streptosporangium fragile]|uniref:NAD-dependent epimerase/dehydratase domain-containing protein n=1 Tax=Streptosporangium fragile TaxID=46186 RepID=A0ABP6I625_9ACTN
MTERVLVLGGTRFVGRHLLERLVALGCAVDVLNRGVTMPPEALPAGVGQLRADRADHGRVRSLLSGRAYDAVFDVSAYRPQEVATVLEALPDTTGHYLLISTCVVYTHLWDPAPGHHDEDPVPIAEDDGTVAGYFGDGDIVVHYAGAKRACETTLLGQDRIPGTVLRPCGIYGRYDDRYRHDYFFDRIAAGRPVLIPDSHVDRRIHLTSVDGLVDACVRAAGRTGDDPLVLNIADRDVLSCGELAEECVRAAGADPRIIVYPRELAGEVLVPAEAGTAPPGAFPFGDEPGFRLDCTRAGEVLGWTAPSIGAGTAALFGAHAERRAAGGRAEPDFRFDDALLARLAAAGSSP